VADDAGGVPTRVVDLDWRSVAVALGGFVALTIITGLVRSAPRTLTVATVGTLLAMALNPVVGRVEIALKVRRAIAVGFVIVGFLAAVGLLLSLLGPPAIRQARDLRQELPEVVDRLGELPVVGDDLVEADAPRRVEEWIRELPSRLSGDTTPITRAGQVALDSLLTGFLTLLVAVTLLLDGPRVVQGLRRLVPAARRLQADRFGDLFYRLVGRYAAGSLFVAMVAGLAVLVAGILLDIPLTPLLAVWVAMFDLVPQIGGAVGGVPFVALAFVVSPTTGVIAAVFFILYLQFENHVLQPIVVGKTVKLSPPATMTAALVGVSAAGVVGAMVAVPLLGALKAAAAELRRDSTTSAREPGAAATA
jgi:predicted PurR-regulated permease PerM